ncbi:hypothetical protein GCM10010462_19280 [Microbacterium dextranolyticum]|uniref:Uncharacterized protein n=1 Tax=Microbacterium dextranolyticum TaxID=36806 RepID=A0A9W6M5S0_9MICO|nr:hypothetical protein GCM10017591_11780 [Microbacterium dextranolyticum]
MGDRIDRHAALVGEGHGNERLDVLIHRECSLSSGPSCGRGGLLPDPHGRVRVDQVPQPGLQHSPDTSECARSGSARITAISVVEADRMWGIVGSLFAFGGDTRTLPLRCPIYINTPEDQQELDTTLRDAPTAGIAYPQS